MEFHEVWNRGIKKPLYDLLSFQSSDFQLLILRHYGLGVDPSNKQYGFFPFLWQFHFYNIY